MPELKDWYKIEEEKVGGGGFELFPRLNYFYIGKCPKLRGSIFQLPPSNFNQIKVEIFLEEYTAEYDGIKGSLTVDFASASIVPEWLPFHNLLAFVEHLTIEAYEITSFPTELEDWIQHLTSLHSLCFINYGELEFLSSINNLSTLRKLEIVNCANIKSLPEEGLPASLQKLIIWNCPNIESLPEEGLPASLQNLKIVNCANIKSLSEEGLPASLQKLKIKECPNIKSLPEKGLPASLQVLKLSDCYDLAKRCMNEDWQKMIAHIPTFKVDYKSLKTMFGDYSYADKEEDEEEE